MARRKFHDWLEAYDQYTTASESPSVFHRWAGVSAIAGALRRKTFIDMGIFRWYPNFFILFVAPPGIVSKSTTADIAMALLRRVDGVHFGPSSVTWQRLVQALAQSKEEYPLPDGTFMPMSAMTIVASEFGTFFDPKNREFVDVMNDLWDGKEGSFDKWTKGSGNDAIENPWINLIACTTPAWIAENFSNMSIKGGFASRTVFIYAEHKRLISAYPAESINQVWGSMQKWRDFGELLTEDLRHIASTMQGEFTLTDDAKQWGREWYVKHLADDNPIRHDSRLEGYMGRKQTQIHKLAMVLSASRRDDLIIDLPTIMEAEKHITSLESDMLATFGHMNKDRTSELTTLVLMSIRKAKDIARSDLYRQFVTRMSYSVFEECMRGLLATGLIEQYQDSTTMAVHIRTTQKLTDIEAKLKSEKHPPLRVVGGNTP